MKKLITLSFAFLLVIGIAGNISKPAATYNEGHEVAESWPILWPEPVWE